jgi:release factor glutamine methyltransferase
MQEGLRYLYHYGYMNTGKTSLQQLLSSAARELEKFSDSARLDAELLLCHALHKPRSYLFSHADASVDHEARERFDQFLARRLGGEPVAYITGRKEFWSMSLEVSPDTLVPRPETEHLVELALDKVGSLEAPKLADLGTGSGAIALALARELPRSTLIATDKSEEAIGVAMRNAKRLGLANVEFRQGDWTAPIAGETFDLVASNPPYVRDGDPALRQLRREPLAALAAGPDGLDDIRRLVRDCPSVTRPGGWLLIEHGADQAPTVAKLFAEAGWCDISNATDLAGRPRVTIGRKPGET